MAVSFSEDFECPAGFQEEEVNGQLYHENIDDDSELWLIRMPSDIELSAIDKKKLFLSGSSNLECFETENGKVLDCFVDRCEIPDICLVLPQKSDKKLHEVKKNFMGSIMISEGFFASDKSVIKSEIEHELIENMHKTDESLNTSNQKREGKKKKRSRIIENELYSETQVAKNVPEVLNENYTKMQQNEIKDEPLSSDFDDLPCHSQR